ncbi:hypothetical protein V7193_14780, partial [Bacillus velezensis]
MNHPETVLKKDLILSQAPVILLQMDVATPTTADETGVHTFSMNQDETLHQITCIVVQAISKDY